MKSLCILDETYEEDFSNLTLMQDQLFLKNYCQILCIKLKSVLLVL